MSIFLFFSTIKVFWHTYSFYINKTNLTSNPLKFELNSSDYSSFPQKFDENELISGKGSESSLSHVARSNENESFQESEKNGDAKKQ